MKNWIINLLTGKFLGRTVAKAVMLAITATMLGWAALVKVFPDIGNTVDPALLVSFVALTTAYFVVFAAAKLTKRPFDELVQALKDGGQWDDAITGHFGDKLKVAMAKAVNDPNVTMERVLTNDPDYDPELDPVAPDPIPTEKWEIKTKQ